MSCKQHVAGSRFLNPIWGCLPLNRSVRLFAINVLIDRLGFELVIFFVLYLSRLFFVPFFLLFCLFLLIISLWFIFISFFGGLLTLCFVILAVVLDFWLISLIYHSLPSRILYYFTYIHKDLTTVYLPLSYSDLFLLVPCFYFSVCFKPSNTLLLVLFKQPIIWNRSFFPCSCHFRSLHSFA